MSPDPERSPNTTDEIHRIATKAIDAAEALAAAAPELTADVAQLAVDALHRAITRIQEFAHLRDAGPPPAA